MINKLIKCNVAKNRPHSTLPCYRKKKFDRVFMKHFFSLFLLMLSSDVFKNTYIRRLSGIEVSSIQKSNIAIF